MKFPIDLTNVKELQPLPAGTYVVKIDEVDGSKLAKSSGKPKLSIKTKVIAPQGTAKEIPIWYLSLSLAEAALFRVKQLFEACNIPLKPSGFDTVDLIGREFGITVTKEEMVIDGQPQPGRWTNQIVAFTQAKLTKPEVAPGPQPVATTAGATPAPGGGNPITAGRQ